MPKIKSAEISDTVAPSESLARYLTSSNHFNQNKKIIRPAAFLPKDSDLRLSVFRIDGLMEKDIWQIGERYVSQPASRNLYGRGEITAQLVLSQKLGIESDNNPPRHADIIQWPEDKPKRLEIAQELAENARLVIK